MALWNEKPTPATAGPAAAPAPQPERAFAERTEPRASTNDPSPAVPPRRPAPRVEGGESVIAANLSIEGKIEGTGNVKIAGRFKGDVQVDGNFRIDPGARLEGHPHLVLIRHITNS